MIHPIKVSAQHSGAGDIRPGRWLAGKGRPWAAYGLALMLMASPLPAQDAEEAASVGGQYVDLQPEFVLNYGLDGRLRYLRLEVTLLLNDAEGATEANHHAPALRHVVVMNVSNTARNDLQTTAGRQALRQRLLDDMQSLMADETGEPVVREILFSNLVLQ